MYYGAIFFTRQVFMKNNSLEDIAVRIKSERERLGINQLAFAAIAEATKRSQINWEQGAAMPNAGVLAAWAKVGADVLYIVTGNRSVDLTSTFSPDKEVLLQAYDAAPVAVRNAALAVLLSGGQAPEGVDTSKERKGRAAPRKVMQYVENNQGGQVYSEVKNLVVGRKKNEKD